MVQHFRQISVCEADVLCIRSEQKCDHNIPTILKMSIGTLLSHACMCHFRPWFHVWYAVRPLAHFEFTCISYLLWHFLMNQVSYTPLWLHFYLYYGICSLYIHDAQLDCYCFVIFTLCLGFVWIYSYWNRQLHLLTNRPVVSHHPRSGINTIHILNLYLSCYITFQIKSLDVCCVLCYFCY